MSKIIFDAPKKYCLKFPHTLCSEDGGANSRYESMKQCPAYIQVGDRDMCILGFLNKEEEYCQNDNNGILRPTLCKQVMEEELDKIIENGKKGL